MEGVNTAGVVSVAVGALTAVTATAATYYLASQPEPNSVPAVDLNNQSDILEVCLPFTGNTVICVFADFFRLLCPSNQRKGDILLLVRTLHACT